MGKIFNARKVAGKRPIIKPKLNDVQINAISKNYLLIRNLNVQSPDIVFLAFDNYKDQLDKLKDEHNKVKKYEYDQYIKIDNQMSDQKSFLELIHDQTDEICKKVVEYNGLELQYVKNKTYDICKLAIINNGIAYMYSIYQTMELFEIAIKSTPEIIYMINNKKYIERGIEINPAAISYIYDFQKLFDVMRINGAYIRFVDFAQVMTEYMEKYDSKPSFDIGDEEYDPVNNLIHRTYEIAMKNKKFSFTKDEINKYIDHAHIDCDDIIEYMEENNIDKYDDTPNDVRMLFLEMWDPVYEYFNEYFDISTSDDE